MVAPAAAVDILDALAPQAERGAALCPFRHRVLYLAVDGGHHHLRAQNGLAVRDRHCDMYVEAVALEHGVRAHRHDHDQVAAGPAVEARVAQTCQAHALIVVDTRGHLYLNTLCAGGLAAAVALGARGFDDLSLAAAA